MTFKNLAITDVPTDPGYCSFNKLMQFSPYCKQPSEFSMCKNCKKIQSLKNMQWVGIWTIGSKLEMQMTPGAAVSNCQRVNLDDDEDDDEKDDNHGGDDDKDDDGGGDDDDHQSEGNESEKEEKLVKPWLNE